MNKNKTRKIVDYIGIGFGPANLSLAIAISELDTTIEGFFLESKPTFQWHPGMLLDNTRMQISFLKDLATLDNPQSQYTFLNYLKAKNRLEDFINLGKLHPSREEFQDYLQWAAKFFRKAVFYGKQVSAIEPVFNKDKTTPSHFLVSAKDSKSNKTHLYQAKHIIYATGGVAKNLPDNLAGAKNVIHAKYFLQSIQAQFPDKQKKQTFTVVGGGQSAIEIVRYLLDNYPNATLHLIIRSYALKPADSSVYVNEIFNTTASKQFYRLEDETKAAVLNQLHNTNYGVVDEPLLDEIYEKQYLDKIRGKNRLIIHQLSEIKSATTKNHKTLLKISNHHKQKTETIRCDGIILGTGYQQKIDESIFEKVLPYLCKNKKGDFIFQKNYRIKPKKSMKNCIFAQGFSEALHGLSETLLSQLPFRAKTIAKSLKRYCTKK